MMKNMKRFLFCFWNRHIIRWVDYVFLISLTSSSFCVFLIISIAVLIFGLWIFCAFFLSCWFHKLQDSLRMNTTTATNNEIKYPEKCELPHDIHVFNLHMHFGVAIYRWWLQNGKRFVRCLCLTLKSSRLR